MPREIFTRSQIPSELYVKSKLLEREKAKTSKWKLLAIGAFFLGYTFAMVYTNLQANAYDCNQIYKDTSEAVLCFK